MAATSSLPSVIDPVAPEGYGFCIVNKGGDVWFHSDSSLNLQENIVRQTGDNVYVQAALSSGLPQSLRVDYHGGIHRFSISPFEGFPLYLVTFYNTESHYASLIEAIRFTGVSILILLVFNGLLLFLFSLRDYREYRKTILIKGFDPFAWLRPIKINEGALRQCCTAIALTLILLVVFRLMGDRTASLFLCASACLFSATASYSLLSKRTLGWNLFFLLGLYLMVTVCGLALMSQRSFYVMLLFHLVLIILLPVAVRFPLKRSVRFETIYVLFFTLWQVLIFVVPVVFFFLDGMNYERKNSWNYSRAKMAERIDSRNLAIEKFFKEKIESSETRMPEPEFLQNTKLYQKKAGVYVDFLHLTEGIRTEGSQQKREASPGALYDRLYYYLKSGRGPGGMLRKGLAGPLAGGGDVGPPGSPLGDRVIHGFLLAESLQRLELVPVPITIGGNKKDSHDFRELLSNCTRTERFVLADLARDLLVNFNNRETIEQLWKRGLLTYDGTFDLMSLDFRNFILTEIDPAEAHELARSLRGDGQLPRCHDKV